MQQRAFEPLESVTGSCELLGVSWELNLGPLQEQRVLLITELSLHP